MQHPQGLLLQLLYKCVRYVIGIIKYPWIFTRQVRSIMKSVHTSQVYIYYVYVNRTPIIMKSDPSNMRQPSQGSTITVCCTEDFGPYQDLIPWYLKLDFWYLRVFSGSLRTPLNQTSLVEELERVQNTCMVFFFTMNVFYVPILYQSFNVCQVRVFIIDRTQ